VGSSVDCRPHSSLALEHEQTGLRTSGPETRHRPVSPRPNKPPQPEQHRENTSARHVNTR
jgi:hypothetical protein